MVFKEHDWWLGTDHRHTKFECWPLYLQYVDIWLHCQPFPWQRLHLCPSLLLLPHPSVWCIIHCRAIKGRSPSIRTVQQCCEWKALLYCAARVHSELRNVHVRCLFFMSVSELDKHMQNLATSGGFRIKSLVIKLVIAEPCEEQHSLLCTSSSAHSVLGHRYSSGTLSQRFTCLTEAAGAKFTPSGRTQRMSRWGHLIFFTLNPWALPV